ncbi:MAG: trans-aconitate 2-methyltransferase [Microcystaceae cyanobacterium]
MTIYPGEVFANTQYFDQGIRQLLPHYDEMLNALTACIPTTASRILELGCGTGELSLKLLNHCPDAHLVALDYSPRMIDFTREKLLQAQLEQRVTLIQGDFGAWAKGDLSEAIGTGFDACVSSLAIHHLTDEMKQELFVCIGKNIKQGGCFWNADPILQESEFLRETYQYLREKWSNNQGIDGEFVRSKIGQSEPQGYSGQDRLASLLTHQTMLSQAQFKTFAIPWHFFGLAIFGGWT